MTEHEILDVFRRMKLGTEAERSLYAVFLRRVERFSKEPKETVVLETVTSNDSKQPSAGNEEESRA
jgi:hypothetical protein